MELSPDRDCRMPRCRVRPRWREHSPRGRYFFVAMAVLLATLATLGAGAVFADPAVAYRIGPGVTWKTQPSGTTQTLRGLDMVDVSSGWVVGTGGTILHTGDGGVRWQKQPSGVSVDLNDVHFLNDRTGWAVGAEGTALRTSDGGITWVECGPDAWTDLFGVHFTSERTGWAVGAGGHVYFTSDAGATWSDSPMGRTDYSDFFLSGVHFVDERTGWIVGKLGYIFGTTDGGKTWTTQLRDDLGRPGTWGPPLLRLAFADAQHGWAVGGFGGLWSEERIFHTDDGGRTWTAQLDGAGTRLGDIACLDRDTAWVVDWFDNVLFTVDGGEH